MPGIRTTYCPTCQKLRAIRDWRGDRETLVIELEPCGHLIRRCARVEWMPRKAAA